MNFWGYHLILNCAACDIEKIDDADNIEAFVKALVPAIDMVAYGEPQIVKFGSGNKEGYTLVQLIETSNICAHFCNENGDAYFDVFSCKEFDIGTVDRLVHQYFNPKFRTIAMMPRDARVEAPKELLTQTPSGDQPA